MNMTIDPAGVDTVSCTRNRQPSRFGNRHVQSYEGAGLCSSLDAVPDNMKRHYRKVEKQLRAAHAPSGEREEKAFEKLLSATWRLKHMHLLAKDSARPSRKRGDRPAHSRAMTAQLTWVESFNARHSINQMIRFQESLDQGFETAVRELRQIQSERLNAWRQPARNRPGRG